MLDIVHPFSFFSSIKKDNSLLPLDRVIFNFAEKSETVLQKRKVSQVSQFLWNFSLYVHCINFPARKKADNGLNYLSFAILVGKEAPINKGHFMLIGSVRLH
jgi:hypothetical protein